MPISHKQAKLPQKETIGLSAGTRGSPVKGTRVDEKPTLASQGFDVLPHDHTDKPHSEPMGGRKRELRDHERGIGLGLKPHPKRMPMQMAPDHGDHE
jgi:hypothetical protein